ncbi:MAG TPA: hypothetical protein VN325_23405 [Steroidobacteraceae bacterium]|nr:hypothetical protein [Steroidobacteraceae bacterium]
MTDALPEGIKEEDLVDGPKVVHLASGRGSFVAEEIKGTAPIGPQVMIQPIPQPAPAVPLPPLPVSGAAAKKDYPAVIEAALDVLSARLLGLIALITACLIWAGVIWDPEIHRIIAAGVFSASVFWPMMLIYWKAGMTGGG